MTTVDPPLQSSLPTFLHPPTHTLHLGENDEIFIQLEGKMMKYSFSLTDKLKQGGVNSSEMRIGQAILTSPSFNSDSLIQNASLGICNPKRPRSHKRFPLTALSLRDFPACDSESKHGRAGPHPPARLPGPSVKVAFVHLSSDPCQECLSQEPSSGFLNSGFCFVLF